MGRRQISTTLFLILLAAAATTTDNNKHFETHTWITPDSTNGNFNLTNCAGRITYPLRLRSAGPASFTTYFTVDIFRPYTKATPGEGLAFIVAADGGSIPVSSCVCWIGLTSPTTDGNANNRFAVVELDTVRNPRSATWTATTSAWTSTVSSPTSPSRSPYSVDLANYTLWVEYSGDTMGRCTSLGSTNRGRLGRPLTRPSTWVRSSGTRHTSGMEEEVGEGGRRWVEHRRCDQEPAGGSSI